MSVRKKSGVSFGPGSASLILIFVVLSLSALGMLSLMSSRTDDRFSARSAEVIEAVYALNCAAEEQRATVDELLVSAAKDARDDADAQSGGGEECGRRAEGGGGRSAGRRATPTGRRPPGAGRPRLAVSTREEVQAVTRP